MSADTHAASSTKRIAVLGIASVLVLAIAIYALFSSGTPQAGGEPRGAQSPESSKDAASDLRASDSTTSKDDAPASSAKKKSSSSSARRSSDTGSSAQDSGDGSSPNDDPPASTGTSPTDVIDDGVEQVTDVVDDVADQLDEPVETVTDVVDELADQLGVGDTADDLTGALDDAGTDLETVTEDVLALVDQGMSLEDAVDQVLGQLPAPALDGAPAPSGSGGTPVVPGL